MPNSGVCIILYRDVRLIFMGNYSYRKVCIWYILYFLCSKFYYASKRYYEGYNI